MMGADFVVILPATDPAGKTTEELCNNHCE